MENDENKALSKDLSTEENEEIKEEINEEEPQADSAEPADNADSAVTDDTEPDAASDEAPVETEDAPAQENPENTEADNSEGSEAGGEQKDSAAKRFGAFFARSKKKILITAGSVIGAAAIIYFAGVIFYSSHFYFGTELGGFDCSNMSIEAARESIQNDVDNYSFTFYEKDGSEEVITGEEIHLECAPISNLDELMERQNPFEWLTDTDNRQIEVDLDVTYDHDALYNRITQMKFMETTRANMEGSTEKIIYADGEYTVDDDGTKDIVSVNEMYNKLQPKIEQLYRGMSMEKESCYTGLAGDDTMKGVLNLLNKYVSTAVTYVNGRKPAVVDKDTINEWLSVGEDYSVNIDAEKAREYVNELAKSYDTIGMDRKFRTSGGVEVVVSGGSYGWNVNTPGETEALLDNIRNGDVVEREPVYRQTAAAHGENNDIANTYVEVSIDAQHMWYYKNGELIVSSDCVTGNTSLNRGTHTGTYYVLYKDKNVILKGQGYETPVTYWMPFNGGEGLHDANWRGVFGGSIFRSNGSHGCVNLPYSVAEKLYQNISPGDPVIIY